MTISIELDETLTAQLAKLCRLTGRAPEDLVLAMIEPTLDQLIAGNDTHLLQAYLP